MLSERNLFAVGKVSIEGPKAPKLQGSAILLGKVSFSKVFKVVFPDGQSFIKMAKLFKSGTVDKENPRKATFEFQPPATNESEIPTEPTLVYITVQEGCSSNLESFIATFEQVRSNTFKKLPSIDKVQKSMDLSLIENLEKIPSTSTVEKMTRNMEDKVQRQQHPNQPNEQQVSPSRSKAHVKSPVVAHAGKLSMTHQKPVSPKSPVSKRKPMRRRLKRLHCSFSSDSDTSEDESVSATKTARALPVFHQLESRNFSSERKSSKIWNPAHATYGQSKRSLKGQISPVRRSAQGNEYVVSLPNPYRPSTPRNYFKRDADAKSERMQKDSSPSLKRQWGDFDPEALPKSPVLLNRKRALAVSPTARKSFPPRDFRSERSGNKTKELGTQSSLVSSSRSSIANGTPGLLNLGNTCYMNCIVQALSCLEGFKSYLKDPVWREVTDNHDDQDSTHGVLDAFVDVDYRTQVTKNELQTQRAPPTITPTTANKFRVKTEDPALGTSSSAQESRSDPFATPPTTKGFRTLRSSAINPENLKLAVEKYSSEFKGNQQHDAHEFLMTFLDALDEECKQAALSQKKATPVNEYFTSVVTQTFTCTECGYSREREETNLVFSLGFNNTTTEKGIHLGQLFKDHFSSEDLEYRCEKCDSQRARVSSALSSIPKILVLHLKRFEMSASLQYSVKRHDGVNPPRKLYPRQLPTTDEIKTSNKYQPYVLRSIVRHSGSSAFSGHYTTAVNRNSKSSLQREKDWLLFNDSIVTQISEVEAAHSDAAQEAGYMMFYELQAES